MKNRRLHINRILSVLLLCVFAIALTPWSSLHHHEEQEDHCTKNNTVCMHKVHVGTEQHNCLVCSAHFEKDYYTTSIAYQVVIPATVAVKHYTLLSGTYTALIGTSLRGPPAV